MANLMPAAFLALAPQNLRTADIPPPMRVQREVPNRYIEYLIFEFGEHELKSFITRKIKFQEQHVKCLIK